MPQLRQNIITGEWVVIAPERAKRPNEYIVSHEPVQDSDDCVFCPDGSATKKIIHHYDTDHAYLIPNKYPAYVVSPNVCTPRTFKVENEFYLAKPAVGGHDVLVVRDHETSLQKFNLSIYRDLLYTARKRFRYYAATCNGDHTILIYNEKSAAGASIIHPHAQIFSSNIIPNLVSRELNTTQDYWEKNGVSPFEDLIKHEKQYRHRVLHENEYYIAFTQYAAKYPFETWILPKFEGSHFEEITNKELAGLAVTLKETLGKIMDTLNGPPLNWFIHSAPHSFKSLPYYRWHLEIIPRLSIFGGYELGSGVIIDIISPEIAAAFLNGKKINFD